MWFKFAKLFFVVNTSVQAPTSLIASNDPNVVNYDTWIVNINGTVF